jgi:hypothetical protein
MLSAMGEVRDSRAGGLALCAVCVCIAMVSGVGCGGQDHSNVVAQIAGKPITKGTLAHWVADLTPAKEVLDPPQFKACIAAREKTEQMGVGAISEKCRRRYTELQHQALQFLIAARWTIAEASARGLQPASGSGEAPLAQPVSLPIQHISQGDLSFEGKVETATASLTRPFERGGHVDNQQITSYYASHKQKFERPERYYFRIWETYANAAAAERDLRRLRSHKPVSSASFPEFLDAGAPSNLIPVRKQFAEAVFAARPHTLVGPEPLLGHYGFFELLRVRPRLATPLSHVRSQVKRMLIDERRDTGLRSFIAAWRRRWTARTDCSPGYVVQKCAQYKGTKAPEEPLAFD